jgi:hypothetical protein
MKKINLFITLFIVITCGCRDYDYKVYKDWKGGYLDTFGKYIMQKEPTTLDVYNAKGLLRYSLIVNKDTALKSKENASIYQRWFLYLDEQRNLWVESSDIGVWVWCKSANGKYHKFYIDERPNSCKAIPKQFLDAMPEGRKDVK